MTAPARKRRRRSHRALTPTPHDAVFKIVFSDPKEAAGLLRAVLPREIVRAADWSTLRLVSSAAPDRRLVERRTDLVFSLEIEGRPLAIVLIFEHQSTPDPWMPWRFLGYVVGQWETHRRVKPRAPLPPVLTLVLTHTSDGWSSSPSLGDLVDFGGLRDALAPFVPTFEHLVIDVSRMTTEQLLEASLTSLVRGLLLLYRDARGGRVVDVLRAHTSIFDAIARDARLEAVEGLLRYALSQAADSEHGDILDVVATLGDENGERTMRSVADKLFEDGYARGVAKGIEKGIEKGQRALLSRTLERRFGSLTAAQRARIDVATAPEIERWVDRILVASSVDELFEER